MLVYDVTDRESFHGVDTWMNEISKVRRARRCTAGTSEGTPDPLFRRALTRT